MPVIKAQKIPVKQKEQDDLVALFCYYYQSYTYAEASKIPYKHVAKMIEVARREKAKDYLNLLEIVSAPHSKKGILVDQLRQRYKSQIID